MIIDNGARVALVIQGVFEGRAGLSEGLLSFTPNRVGRSPALARGALLNGDPVRLYDVTLSDDGRSCTAKFETL